MSFLQVEQEKCICCGICSDVCPVKMIGMESQGPKAIGEHCIACGHCVAVCPTGALDNEKAPLANQLPLEKMPVLDADTAARFLRSRRSIRNYKETQVPREKIRQLLDIARLAPTGSNSQGISYYVFDRAETLRKVVAAVIQWMEEEVKKASAWAPYFTGIIDSYHKNGYDGILRGAPCLVVAATPKDFFLRGRDNTHFSLAYAELYAPSIGLGSCWAGFFEICATNYPPLMDVLGLPEDMAVTGALMVGYPKYTYKRLVDRNPLQVTWQEN